MKLVIIGAPGAGKGTQSRVLSKKYGIGYIATGDMLREEIKAGSEIGKQVETVIKEGGLVTDDLMIRIVKARLEKDDCKNGFMLDGFPRTAFQVEQLKGFVGELRKAIFIDVPDDVLLERLSDRETCVACGAIYNKKSHPSKEEGKCDLCGNDLMTRDDDNPEVAASRLKKFHQQTEPLLDYYRDLGILITVNGVGAMEDISAEIIKGIGE